MKKFKIHLSDYIAAQPVWVFTLFASLAAFFTYSCMYAFRKPFAIGTFDGHILFGVHYKIWMITAQVIGYTISKFIGIRFVSEMTRNKRALSILILVGLAEFALLLVYLVSPPYNFIFMFFNGLPLGIIWGLVFSYLEGRQLTEILGAILCASFIIASGVVKSVGEYLIVHFRINEFLMPFITGLIFLIPMIIFVHLLDSIPAPTTKDEQLRSKRAPMNKFQRKVFLNEFFIGIILLIVAYTFLTIFREMRDNFANEIWTSLGLGKNPAIFTLSELPVAIITLGSIAMVAFIKHNFIAFNVILFIILFGFMLIIGASVLFYLKFINGVAWMIIVGIGLYIGYVPFNAFLYERMISSFRVVSNIGFIMYLSDAFGYFGSVIVVFIKNFFSPSISWVNFFTASGIWVSFAGIVLIIGSIIYFNNKYKYSNHQEKEVNEYIRTTRKSLFVVDTGTPIYK